MNWIAAGRIIFWITLLATLGWAAFGAHAIATAFFVLGLAFTAEAFIAAKAESVFPQAGHSCSLGFFSCTLSAKADGLFDRITLKVDAKNVKTPFELVAHAKKIAWKTKEKAKKNRKAFEKIVGLVEADIQEKQARILFEDEPNIKQSIQETLQALRRIWR